MSEVWADTRTDGAHGIGRYAREVLQRLAVRWRPLELDGTPQDPFDALRRLPRAVEKGLVYSPSYNAFVRAKRQLLTMHDLIQLRTPWPGRAKYLAYYALAVKPVIRRTGAVLTVSETSKRLIEEWLGDDRVRVVNAGIGCSPAFRADVTPAESSDPYLMYVGNLRAHKNLAVVLDALTLVPDARLRALLPASEHEAARAALARRGLERRVELLAGLDDDELARQYRGAAATVMPSIQEGFGLPALESIRTGTPVFYWQGCAAVAETAVGHGTAVGSADDPAEWAYAIGKAFATPRRVEPPRAGYDWDETARRIDDTLVSLGASR